MRWFKTQSQPFGGVSILSFTFDDYIGECHKKIGFPLTTTVACELRNPEESMAFCENMPSLIEHYSQLHEEEFSLDRFWEPVKLDVQENSTIGDVNSTSIAGGIGLIEEISSYHGLGVKDGEGI